LWSVAILAKEIFAKLDKVFSLLTSILSTLEERRKPLLPSGEHPQGDRLG